MFEPRSPQQIARIAAAGQVAALALDRSIRAARVGLSTRAIEQIVAQCLREHGASAVLQETHAGRSFPGVCAVNVNEELAHGLPGDRLLVDGDVVTIDVACRLNGWCADAARTVIVGQPGATAARLVAAAQRVTQAAIDAIPHCRRWSEVVSFVQAAARREGLPIAPQFSGHGIGRELHEPPRVPFGPDSDFDFELSPGLVIAVEPIVLEAPCGMTLSENDWTLVANPPMLSACFEHTIAIGPEGATVLTRS